LHSNFKRALTDYSPPVNFDTWVSLKWPEAGARRVVVAGVTARTPYTESLVDRPFTCILRPALTHLSIIIHTFLGIKGNPPNNARSSICVGIEGPRQCRPAGSDL